ncbi:MAG: aminotransferase class I/II-fold pyridoxal phosphate-dependent enzyme [Anaerolineae bacterium]|jgi:LL-diaminopimelate aminotransferase
MIKPAKRLSDLPAYPFARWAEHIAEARQRGLDVIRLDMGNPDMPPRDEVIDALARAAGQRDQHGYPGYRGIPALRRSIAAYYDQRFGVNLDPTSEVIPLLGSKEGLVNLALAYLEPGDTALVPDPGYAPYTRGAILAGADVYTFPLLPEQGFLPDLGAIPRETATCAKVVWLNYPNNPTGATAGLDFFAGAVDFARQHDLLLCHDAPYADVTYDGYRAPSMLQVPGAREVVVEFSSLSKMANMAGWRVGMAVGNAAALTALAQVKSNVDSGIFRPLQVAATMALSTSQDWIAERNRVYRERLDLLEQGLHALGMEAARPKATLYLWSRIPSGHSGDARGGWTSESFARTLLERTGIAVAPGSFFGPGGEGFIRVSATASTAQIQEAKRRLQTFELRSSRTDEAEHRT